MKTPRLGGELAPLLGFREFEGTLVFTNTSPIRVGGGNGDLGCPVRPPGSLQVQPGSKTATTGVRRMAELASCAAARTC
jgi:hypothetical protein